MLHRCLRSNLGRVKIKYITYRDALFINTSMKKLTRLQIRVFFSAQIPITRAKMAPRHRRRSTAVSRSPSTPLPTW